MTELVVGTSGLPLEQEGDLSCSEPDPNLSTPHCCLRSTSPSRAPPAKQVRAWAKSRLLGATRTASAFHPQPLFAQWSNAPLHGMAMLVITLGHVAAAGAAEIFRRTTAARLKRFLDKLLCAHRSGIQLVPVREGTLPLRGRRRLVRMKPRPSESPRANASHPIRTSHKSDIAYCGKFFCRLCNRLNRF
jgi:hypothetical protein